VIGRQGNTVQVFYQFAFGCLNYLIVLFKGKTGKDIEFKEIVNNAFDENFIWLCRTCMACVEACPAFIDHVDALIEIRRNETAIKGRLPVQASKTLKNMESLGNPFASQDERGKCIKDLDVPVISPGESVEVLYWIGCFKSFDPIKRKIAVDLCDLLKKMEVNFGILGFDEHCCGDPARILGEEYLFQTIAKKQISELNLRNFNMLLVSCPHGYTVLKDEYPRFGGKYKVVHYIQLLDDIVRNKGLHFRASDKRAITYHDPCFLGRYQNVYDAPRNLINAIPKVRFIEMKNHRENSFCCGGGGGHFWMDIKDGEKINHLRVKQAVDAGADTIVTACPFCLHMLDDAVKSLNLEGKIEVLDIIWLLQEFLSI